MRPDAYKRALAEELAVYETKGQTEEANAVRAELKRLGATRGTAEKQTAVQTPPEKRG